MRKLQTRFIADISKYTENFFLGMSARQTIFGLLGVALVAGGSFVLPIPPSMSVILGLPILLMGFYKPEGVPLEQYVHYWLESKMINPQIRYYQPDSTVYDYLWHGKINGRQVFDPKQYASGEPVHAKGKKSNKTKSGTTVQQVSDTENIVTTTTEEERVFSKSGMSGKEQRALRKQEKEQKREEARQARDAKKAEKLAQREAKKNGTAPAPKAGRKAGNTVPEPKQVPKAEEALMEMQAAPAGDAAATSVFGQSVPQAEPPAATEPIPAFSNAGLQSALGQAADPMDGIQSVPFPGFAQPSAVATETSSTPTWNSNPIASQSVPAMSYADFQLDPAPAPADPVQSAADLFAGFNPDLAVEAAAPAPVAADTPQLVFAQDALQHSETFNVPEMLTAEQVAAMQEEAAGAVTAPPVETTAPASESTEMPEEAAAIVEEIEDEPVGDVDDARESILSQENFDDADTVETVEDNNTDDEDVEAEVPEARETPASKSNVIRFPVERTNTRMRRMPKQEAGQSGMRRMPKAPPINIMKRFPKQETAQANSRRLPKKEAPKQKTRRLPQERRRAAAN